MLSACSYVYADKFTAFVQNVCLPSANAYIHRNVSCVHIRRSARLSWCPSEFQNSAAQSCFLYTAGGENKRCLLPQRAADAEVIASHWAYQHIREWVRVSAGQSSSTPCSWDYKIELLRRETRCTLFHRNSGHRTVQIVSRWITKSGLQRGSASSRQRFEMLTNCDSVCWTFGSALNKTSSTHPLTSGVCDSKHACVLNKIAVNLSA